MSACLTPGDPKLQRGMEWRNGLLWICDDDDDDDDDEDDDNDDDDDEEEEEEEDDDDDDDDDSDDSDDSDDDDDGGDDDYYFLSCYTVSQFKRASSNPGGLRRWRRTSKTEQMLSNILI